MPRQPKPDHNGQGILPGCAHYRPKSKRVNGRRRGDEQALYDAIREVCFHRPGIVSFIARTNSGTAYTKWGAIELLPEGWPDFTGGLVDSRLLGIEAKLPGEELEPAQIEWKERFEHNGHVYLVVHSREECAELLEAIPLRVFA